LQLISPFRSHHIIKPPCAFCRALPLPPQTFGWPTDDA
jgi:hypothetical protein